MLGRIDRYENVINDYISSVGKLQSSIRSPYLVSQPLQVVLVTSLAVSKPACRGGLKSNSPILRRE
jgi:hypothetical protein